MNKIIKKIDYYSDILLDFILNIIAIFLVGIFIILDKIMKEV